MGHTRLVLTQATLATAGFTLSVYGDVLDQQHAADAQRRGAGLAEGLRERPREHESYGVHWNMRGQPGGAGGARAHDRRIMGPRLALSISRG